MRDMEAMVQRKVLQALEDVFAELAQKWNLLTGDFSPDQEQRFSGTVADIVDLILEWREVNR